MLDVLVQPVEYPRTSAGGFESPGGASKLLRGNRGGRSGVASRLAMRVDDRARRRDESRRRMRSERRGEQVHRSALRAYAREQEDRVRHELAQAGEHIRSRRAGHGAHVRQPAAGHATFSSRGVGCSPICLVWRARIAGPVID